MVTVALSIPRETALPRKENEVAAVDRSRASTHRGVGPNSRHLGHSRGQRMSSPVARCHRLEWYRQSLP